MIQVVFDPTDIPGSVLLTPDQITNIAAWVIKLREGADPLSENLRSGLSINTKQILQAHDVTQPPSAALQDAILTEVNKQLEGLPLYDKKSFKGTIWSAERETLIKRLIKHIQDLMKANPTSGSGFTCFNRLLLEEIYPQEIKESAKAEWEGWTFLANAAKAKVITDWEDWKTQRAAWRNSKVGAAPVFEAKLDDDIWKGFRDWLKTNVFHDKCAYCESKIVGFPGDTEHFRPKNRVRVIQDDEKSVIVKVVDEEGDEINHPGYFWLAYHWQNLLPSCQFCNAAGGKLDVFPVEKPHVAVKKLTVKEIDDLLDRITQSQVDPAVFYLEPRDLDRLEGRLLLHPYYDKPEEHLFFDVEGKAEVWNNSEKGKWSRRVYNLNETSKLNARRERQHEARSFYMALMAATDVDVEELKKAARKFMDKYYCGSLPYAAAVFDFIHNDLENTRYDPERLLGERRKRN